ncbi:CdaR family transcriptional regulator [Anaerotalea alkaliphila]|uniref:Carbohydrate diacid regulator n=1 Tax=Anaerotalea alkaliphila TaxID=2662126 RepID=A0A7X5HVF8_9FIRM|nr:sugar diacid recognition domain-containing protein [Anaerotalea alkaliphila]NDL67372.1 hypothetical protein [Anaerotalea alkaliphila]
MSILEPALAQKFIEKTAHHLEYNINIMNDKGIIIASKDASRIGDFHEVAFGMLNGSLDTGIVQEDQKYLGTKPGVNLFIDYKNKHVGVICVTGNPESVNAFAALVKTSMEAMLEYELQMETERKRKNKAEQFLYYVLFEENVEASVAANMAEDLGLDKDLLRVCIILHARQEIPSQAVIAALLAAEGHSRQDIVTIARNDDVILFKSLGAPRGNVVRDYRKGLDEYLEAVAEQLPGESPIHRVAFFIGSLQGSVLKYRASYLHAQELRLKIKEKSGVFFFQDHVLDYFRSLVTIKEYDNIFNTYVSLFDEEEKQLVWETVEALRQNNYNVVNSAKSLFVHRNTLLFRLNKIKDVLNIDPIANAKDRDFLNELAYYFHKK